MKKLLSGLLLFLILAPVVSAQDFDYAKAYRDYEYNYSLYQKAHDNYVLARARYLAYKTLVSEEEVKKATYKMLTSRDEVLKTLLTAIRMRIKENQGLSDGEKESLFSQIDPEVKFYADHQVRLPSAGSLTDFVKDSQVAKEHYNSATEFIIYSSLVNSAIGKTGEQRGRIEKVISELKAKVQEIEANGDKDVSFLDRTWVNIENKLLRSRDKETEALGVIAASQKSFKNKVDGYNDAIGLIQGSYLYLQETVSYLKEAIRLIKTR